MRLIKRLAAILKVMITTVLFGPGLELRERRR
jgi:hypothetical protein